MRSFFFPVKSPCKKRRHTVYDNEKEEKGIISDMIINFWNECVKYTNIFFFSFSYLFRFVFCLFLAFVFCFCFIRIHVLQFHISLSVIFIFIFFFLLKHTKVVLSSKSFLNGIFFGTNIFYYCVFVWNLYTMPAKTHIHTCVHTWRHTNLC